MGPPRSGASPAVPSESSPIGYIPCDVANAYGLGETTATGSGMVIAIVDAFDQPNLATDLQGFDNTFRLPAPTLNVLKPFGQPGPQPSNGNWDLEITLDVEWAHAVAPGATIDLVETLNDQFSLPVGQSAGDLASGVFYATNTLDADVVSMSWGLPESDLTAGLEAQLNGYFPSVNGAGRPITFVASAGDLGFGASWPAIAPTVLGVGGTSLAPGAFGYSSQPGSHTDCSGVTLAPGVTSANETVWGGCSSTTCAGTGGGPSAFEPKPSWQSISPGTTRVSPDVAMLADPATGVALFFKGMWANFMVGGTSLSAPMWGGIAARLDQARRANGLATLSATPTAFWPYAASSGDFNDITTGSSPPTPSDPCISNGSCVARPGYDEVTGRGSPLLATLLADLAQIAGSPAFESLGGTFTSSPASSSWSLNRLDVFGRGVDGALWHKWWDGSAWSGWESLGGALTSAPAVVSWASNRIDVFVRGTDDALWHKWWDGSAWSGWQSLGGQLTEAPGVASWGPNRLDVFVPGGGGLLWHKWWDGGAWSGWESLGGVLTAGPGAVSWASNRIDVFGRGTDDALWHKWWDGSAWSGWEPHGGVLNPAAPAPASTAPSRLDVYVAESGGVLWRVSWNAGWSGWIPGPAGSWQFGPAAVSQAGSGSVDVFVVGPDSAIWHAAA